MKFFFHLFVVASCMLIILSPLFVQVMHRNYYKIVIIVAPTCFGLHKPSSGSSQPMLRRSYNLDFGYISLFEVIGIVAAYFVQSCYACGSCTVQTDSSFTSLPNKRSRGRRIRTLARLRARRQRSRIRLLLGSEQIGNSN